MYMTVSENGLSNKSKTVKLLDCTLRDGGYLNNWKFSHKLAKDVYRAVSDAGIDFFEIGFKGSKKFLDSNKFGLWRFSEDKDILSVKEDIQGAKICVMADFGKFDTNTLSAKCDTEIDLVRVAVHKNKIAEALSLCEKIKDKGYLTSLQMMGYSAYTCDEQNKIVDLLKNSSLDYAYVADSYGSILPFQVKDLLTPLVEISNIKVGFHPHNNLQMAFANSLAAIDAGVDIIDGSIYGIGRGAGNLPIETLVSYLQRLNIEKYNVLPLLNCVDKYFIDMRKKIKWGYQLPYMLSGMFGCHPYYAKKLVDLREFTIEDIWTTLGFVCANNPIGYSEALVEDLINKGVIGSAVFTENSVPPDYVNRHAGADFLILANGPMLKKFKTRIDQFIKEYAPIVLGANYLGKLFVPTYHAFNNKRRFIDYIDTVNSDSKIILGQNLTSIAKSYTDKSHELLIYNPHVANFDIVNGVIQSNCKTISVLLAGLAIVMGSKRVFIAGMDGYIHKTPETLHFYSEKDNPAEFEENIKKHKWCEHFLTQINNYLITGGKEGLHIITPTGYSRFYKSINHYV